MASQPRNPRAAGRFYLRSHERWLIDNPNMAPEGLSMREGIAAISKEGHRYHCVYNHLLKSPHQKVVELGFGPPILINAIASLGDSLTIVDIVDRSSGITLPANTTLEIADLNESFPFKDEQFDSVIAMMIVEHLFDPFHTFRELARIVRVGGHVFVNLPNIASIRCRIALLGGMMPVTSSADWFEKREWDGNHLHYFTAADVKRLSSLFGLRLLAIHPVGRFLLVKRLRPTLFCHEISYGFLRTA